MFYMSNRVDSSSNIRDRTFSFGLLIINLCEFLPKKRAAWVIADQLIRAATSIGANVIEAKGASSRLEFKRYYEIALKSANETEYWLRMLRESGLLDIKRCDDAIKEVLEIQKMIGSAVLKLKNSK